MEFAVRHVPAGSDSVRDDRLSGTNATDVSRQLQRSGSVVLSIEPIADNARQAWTRHGDFDVAWWCKELETLLRAGMTVVEAIETLAAGGEAGHRREIHQRLMGRLRQGAALSDALRSADVFPDVLIAGVAASERSSRLPDALAEYQSYHETLAKLRRQATSAALYPAMVVAVGMVVSLFLLLYVIPRFSRMYGGLPQQMSPATEFVLKLSALLRDHGIWVLLGLLGFGAVAWIWGRSGGGRRLVAWLLEELGPVARVWSHFRLAQLYQALALLIRGGYSLDESIHIALGMRLGLRWTTALAATRVHIANGRAASIAFADAGLTDATSERLLAVGERSGAFDQVLQVVAQRHTQQFSTLVERATRIVEPLLLLLVAVFVGALVVMMYMPIFDMAGGLGGSR
jgi:general secretion pathway protein F